MERHKRSARVARWIVICVLAVAGLGAGMLFAGCGDSGSDAAKAPTTTAGRPTPSPEVMQIGARIFKEICQSCHTFLGKRNPPMTNGEPQGPNLDEVVLPRKEVEERVISGGIAMAAWVQELTRREFRSIVTYVTDLAGRNLGPDEDDPAVLAAGERVFVEHCNVCHTINGRPRTGDPELPGADFTIVKPSARYVRWMVVNRYGFMEAFRGKLTKQQIRDVAAFVQAKSG